MAESASEVRAAIAQDRAELADTVQSLVAKADVKGRVKGKMADGAAHLRNRAEEVAEEVIDYVGSGTPEFALDAARTTAGRVRKNPYLVLTVLTIGILLGWRLGRRG